MSSIFICIKIYFNIYTYIETMIYEMEETKEMKTEKRATS